MEAIVLMNPPARVFSEPSEAINERRGAGCQCVLSKHIDQMQQPALRQGGGILAGLLYQFPFVVWIFLNYKKYKGQQVSCGVCLDVCVAVWNSPLSSLSGLKMLFWYFGSLN